MPMDPRFLVRPRITLKRSRLDIRLFKPSSWSVGVTAASGLGRSSLVAGDGPGALEDHRRRRPKRPILLRCCLCICASSTTTARARPSPGALLMDSQGQGVGGVRVCVGLPVSACAFLYVRPCVCVSGPAPTDKQGRRTDKQTGRRVCFQTDSNRREQMGV